jgi:hypothetical protein
MWHNNSSSKTQGKYLPTLYNYALTVRFLLDDPVERPIPYRCFNCSIPGAAMNITYGMNSEELWSIFKALEEETVQ